MTQEFEVAKGNKDWYGVDAILRNRVRATLQNTFELYGFEPIETPIIENRATIEFKGGGEIQKEVFQLSDQGERRLALRFDQTLPLARFFATHNEIKLPFKRYAIGPVFRDGPTQPDQGRYRQFTQCDVDTLGVSGMAAEAELFTLAQDAFNKLGLGGVEVNINNRKLLEGILDAAEVLPVIRQRAIITLDKMDKIGETGVREALMELTLTDKPRKLSDETLKEIVSYYVLKERSSAVANIRPRIVSELGDRGFNDIIQIINSGKPLADAVLDISNYQVQTKPLIEKSSVDKLMDIVRPGEDNKSTLDRLAKSVKSVQGLEGLKEVRQLLDYTKAMNLDFVKLNPSLARGLDYYTGTTIEVYLKDRGIVNSAILAGGRFDNMVGDFRGGDEIPAVGFSFGLERVVMALRNKPENNEVKVPTQVYLIPAGNVADQCLRIAHELRLQGICTDMEMRGGKMGKSIGYADGKGIPYVAIVGESEINEGVISLKNLKSGKQERLPVNEVGRFLNQKYN